MHKILYMKYDVDAVVQIRGDYSEKFPYGQGKVASNTIIGTGMVCGVQFSDKFRWIPEIALEPVLSAST